MIEISGVYAELFLKKAVPHIILCWGLFSFAGLEELNLAGILIL